MICARPASEPITDDGFERHHEDLLVRRLGERFQRLHVVVGDEVVDRLHVARGDGVGNHLRRLGLGLGASARAPRRRGRRLRAGPRRRSTTACFSPSAAGSPPAAQPSASRICARFSRSAFICRRHAVDEIARRIDVLDLDARDLDAPGLRRLRRRTCSSSALIWSRLDNSSSRSMRAHDGADVGHGEVDDRRLELVDLVGGARRRRAPGRRSRR